jgi:sodium transport system permease protein
MNPAWIVFRKELKDALRDRRTWIVMLIGSLVGGPVIIFLASKFIASIEANVARREVFLSQPASAPTLVNFIQRAGGTVRDAPADFREQMKAGQLHNAVVVVPEDFEARLARGETIRLDVVYDDSSTRAKGPIRATQGLLRAFNQELGSQRLLARGVSPQTLASLEINGIDMASAQSRGEPLLISIALTALIAAVVGAISVAVDETAGERERGSLEPLLMNPVALFTVVLGKWGVVFIFSSTVMLLTVTSYMAAMQFISSETLAALMQFGVREVGLFLVTLLPFSATVAAVAMLAAIYGRTHKEALVYVNYMTMLTMFAPMAMFFVPARDALWLLFVPALAQQSVLLRVLIGEPLRAVDLLLPAAIALSIAAAALAAQARLLANERIVFSR